MRQKHGGQNDYMARLSTLLWTHRLETSATSKPVPIREVALKIGVSPATVSRVERGLPPDLESFRRICLWLGVSADEILGTLPVSRVLPPQAASTGEDGFVVFAAADGIKTSDGLTPLYE